MELEWFLVERTTGIWLPSPPGLKKKVQQICYEVYEREEVQSALNGFIIGERLNMIGNTGDTQPLKVPGLPLCMRFRGKPDDSKKFTHQDDEDSSLYVTEASAQAPEEPSEENLLVVRPRPAERRAEDFMRDWMRRFTRS